MSDIDIAVADSLKVLDPNRPIREADIMTIAMPVDFGALRDILQRHANLVAFQEKQTSRAGRACRISRD